MCRMRAVAYCNDGTLYWVASLFARMACMGVLVVSLASGLLSLVFF